MPISSGTHDAKIFNLIVMFRIFCFCFSLPTSTSYRIQTPRSQMEHQQYAEALKIAIRKNPSTPPLTDCIFVAAQRRKQQNTPERETDKARAKKIGTSEKLANILQLKKKNCLLRRRRILPNTFDSSRAPHTQTFAGGGGRLAWDRERRMDGNRLPPLLAEVNVRRRTNFGGKNCVAVVM